jgi:hypothetical protein
MTTQEFLDAIKAMPAKVAALAPWKKYLIGGSIVIVILAGTHIGAYVAGTKSLKPYQPPTITLTTPKPTTDMNEDNPLAYMCGNKIDISTKMVNDKKLMIIAEDECKKTTAYYALAYNCPALKWSISIAPGFMIGYDMEGKKVYPMIGGGLGFQRHWGNLSLGPEILVYSMIDKSHFSIGANLKFEYRFGK